jgi:hypothetical protein
MFNFEQFLSLCSRLTFTQAARGSGHVEEVVDTRDAFNGDLRSSSGHQSTGNKRNSDNIEDEENPDEDGSSEPPRKNSKWEDYDDNLFPKKLACPSKETAGNTKLSGHVQGRGGTPYID